VFGNSGNVVSDEFTKFTDASLSLHQGYGNAEPRGMSQGFEHGYSFLCSDITNRHFAVWQGSQVYAGHKLFFETGPSELVRIRFLLRFRNSRLLYRHRAR
jgi:hypothetical protein